MAANKPRTWCVCALLFDDGSAFVDACTDAPTTLRLTRRAWPDDPDPRGLTLEEAAEGIAAYGRRDAWEQAARLAGLRIRSFGLPRKTKVPADAMPPWPDFEGAPRIGLHDENIPAASEQAAANGGTAEGPVAPRDAAGRMDGRASGQQGGVATARAEDGAAERPRPTRQRGRPPLRQGQNRWTIYAVVTELPGMRPSVMLGRTARPFDHAVATMSQEKARQGTMAHRLAKILHLMRGCGSVHAIELERDLRGASEAEARLAAWIGAAETAGCTVTHKDVLAAEPAPGMRWPSSERIARSGHNLSMCAPQAAKALAMAKAAKPPATTAAAASSGPSRKPSAKALAAADGTEAIASARRIAATATRAAETRDRNLMHMAMVATRELWRRAEAAGPGTRHAGKHRTAMGLVARAPGGVGMLSEAQRHGDDIDAVDATMARLAPPKH